MISTTLKVNIGQASHSGRRKANHDFHGASIASEPLLTTKGIVVAIADGIDKSSVSQIASETAVKTLVQDYYSTSETWSVQKSAEQVLTATNSWLFSQTQKTQMRSAQEHAYICTLSALILKSHYAHIFHVGDTKIVKVSNGKVTYLTKEHRLNISSEEHYLSRAMGAQSFLDIDYCEIEIKPGDAFFLMTDGVHECLTDEQLCDALRSKEPDLNKTANSLLTLAYEAGSKDNLTLQIVVVEQIPDKDTLDIVQSLTQLPFPPKLEANSTIDDYQILKKIHTSQESHVYLAINTKHAEKESVILKLPCIEQQQNSAYIERFLTEEWIAKRINNNHVLKPNFSTNRRNYLYTTFEYIDGQSLHQWMIDNPSPSLEEVRTIIEQIAKGLRAFHRQEMLHQDLRPQNIMIDKYGVVKIIGFGSAKVAGLHELVTSLETSNRINLAQYNAPEYFLGETGDEKSDLFSLGVIAYELLTGKLPYDVKVSEAQTRTEQAKLRYRSVQSSRREIPPWIDETLKKALHTNPNRRYQTLSEFVFALRQPSDAFLNKTKAPLIERKPVVFWKIVSGILFLALCASLIENFA